MSNFNFVIPLNWDDLFESSSVNQYVVENVYNVRDLKVKIQDANHDVQQCGADFVLREGFDIIFSVLQEFHKDVNVHMKQQAMEIVMQAMLNNIEQLAQVLNSGKYLPSFSSLLSSNNVHLDQHPFLFSFF